MNPLSIFGDIVQAVTAPIDAVSGLFNSITGVSDSWKTMTGRGDTSSIKQSKNLMDYQMENQKKLMQFGNDLQLAQWNRENAYNHPTQQLERLRQAGLNPLFHGLDGNASGGLSAVSAPSVPDLGSILNAVGATMQMRFQQMQTRAQVALLDAEKKKTEQETKNLETENQIRSIDLNFKRDDDWFYHGNYFFIGSDDKVYTADDDVPEGVVFYSPDTFKNLRSLQQLSRNVGILDQELSKARRENKLGDLDESNFEQYISNKLRRDNASTEEAEWAARQAAAIFANLVTEGSQMELDLGNDRELSNIERKFGLAGDAVKMLVDVVKMVRGRSSRR